MQRAIYTLIAATILLVASIAPAAAKRPAKPVPATTAIDKKLSGVSIDGAGLLRALETLAAKANVRIQVEWSALNAIGVQRNSKVAARAGSLTLAQWLDLVCSRVEGRKRPLGWRVSGKVIQITTQARLLNTPDLAPNAPAPAAKPTRRKVVRGRTLTLDFNDTEAVDAVAFFRDRFDMNIVVHWNSLEAVGISKDTPVTLKITKPIPLTRALDLFVENLSGDRPIRQQVFWVRSRNVVTVTTGEVLDSKMSTRVSDVSDLLMVTPNFVGPTLRVSRSSTDSDSGGSSSGGFGGSDQQFGQSTAGRGRNAGSTNQQRAIVERKLIDTVRNSIGEDFWEPAGRGKIRILNGRMIITQSQLGFMLMNRSMSGGSR